MNDCFEFYKQIYNKLQTKLLHLFVSLEKSSIKFLQKIIVLEKDTLSYKYEKILMKVVLFDNFSVKLFKLLLFCAKFNTLYS